MHIDTCRVAAGLLRGSARVVAQAPCAKTSVHTQLRNASVDGYANCIRIVPRDARGATCVYVRLEDVDASIAAVKTDGSECKGSGCDARVTLGAHAQDICIEYTVNTHLAVKNVHVRVHACGVLLLDVYAPAGFGCYSGSRLRGCYSVPVIARRIAINHSGSRLATTSWHTHAVHVFELPGLLLLNALGRHGRKKTQLYQPGGVCFTRNDTLLIADTGNMRVQHWALDGAPQGSFTAAHPRCIAALGDVVAVGGWHGVCQVRGLGSGSVLHAWTAPGPVTAISFIDADTLVLTGFGGEAHVYAFDGTYLRQLRFPSFTCTGPAIGADGSFFQINSVMNRIGVFTADCDAVMAAPFTAQPFSHRRLHAIAIRGSRAYVLEAAHAEEGAHIWVFE
jgi:hypothetical protein